MEEQLPVLRNISSINQFNDIKKVAQWPADKLTTFYNSGFMFRSTLRQQGEKRCTHSQQLH
jgi:hypothetical protein